MDGMLPRFKKKTNTIFNYLNYCVFEINGYICALILDAGTEGVREGCLGETCAVALLLGFIYLLIRKVISPVIPLCFVGTVAVIMLIAGKGSLTFTAYQLLSGGLLLGAVFMATDYSTSPISAKGKIIFAVGCGIVTSLIRIFGNLPEGVSFSIILMNILVPHIEHLTAPKPFGTLKEKKEKKEAAA